MNELHRHRAFTHARSHALNRAMPDIAYGEQAGNICFQEERVSLKVPVLGALAFPHEIRTCKDEAAIISFYQIAQPISTRERANKDKHGTGRYTLNFVRV